MLVHKRNKKFLVNALRVLGHFLCRLENDTLEESLNQKHDFLTDFGSSNLEILFKDLMNLLQHKFPKYGWNVAYILNNLVHRQFGPEGEGTVRNELKTLLFTESPNLIQLFLDTPNLKKKLSMVDLLIEPKIYEYFTLKQTVDLFKFFFSLKTGEWEKANLPKYGEISAIQELNNRQFPIILNLMEKFFSDETFFSNEEEGEYLVTENNLQIEPDNNDTKSSELLRTQLIKLSCEWYEDLMNELNEQLRA